MHAIKPKRAADGRQFVDEPLHAPLPDRVFIGYIGTTAPQLIVKYDAARIRSQRREVVQVVMRRARPAMEYEQGKRFLLSPAPNNAIPDAVAILDRNKAFLFAHTQWPFSLRRNSDGAHGTAGAIDDFERSNDENRP